MMISRSDPVATLSWSLDVKCPHCHEDNDLSIPDDDGIVSVPIFNNKWEDIVGQTFECQECGADFKIGKVEY